MGLPRKLSKRISGGQRSSDFSLRDYRKKIRRKELELSKIPYLLLCNGQTVGEYPSHTAAKKAMHEKIKDLDPYDDEWYELKPKRL